MNQVLFVNPLIESSGDTRRYFYISVIENYLMLIHT